MGSQNQREREKGGGGGDNRMGGEQQLNKNGNG